jgi:hypothetical protein
MPVRADSGLGARDAKSALWAEMKARIGSRNPGGLVARWCKDYTEAVVFAAHFEAMRDNPADYTSWMAAKLKTKTDRNGLVNGKDMSNRGNWPIDDPRWSAPG